MTGILDVKGEHMKDFLRIELIKSLFFPGLCALWVTVRFIDELLWGADFTAGNYFRPISYISALVFGCGVPVLLTLTRNIHTERYFKKRLIIFIVMYVGLSFLNLISDQTLYTFYYLFFGVGSVVYQVFKVQGEDTPAAERAVLMLSDPVIYWTIYHVVAFTSFLTRR